MRTFLSLRLCVSARVFRLDAWEEVHAKAQRFRDDEGRGRRNSVRERSFGQLDYDWSFKNANGKRRGPAKVSLRGIIALKGLLLSKPLVSWWTPAWSRSGRFVRERHLLFNTASLLRVAVVASVCCLVIVWLLRLAFPLLPLANLRWLGVQIPGLLLACYGGLWLYRLIPERVSIFDSCLLIQHGDNATTIAKENLVHARIVVFADGVIRLRVWYLHRGRQRNMALGLAEKVDLRGLEQALGVPLVVYDARERALAKRAVGSGSARAGRAATDQLSQWD